MSIQSVKTVLPIYPYSDVDGTPLENGYIYIGKPGLNPQTNAITVYWDVEGTTPAAQPIRTIGGQPSRSGSVGSLFIPESAYSITILDKNRKLVYSALTVYQNVDLENSAEITTLSDLVSSIGADKAHIKLSAGTWVVDADLTVPDTITLNIPHGATIKPASGKTVTISGYIEAGLYQVFDLSAGGSVAGPAKAEKIYPEWWGAAVDGSTNDAAAIQNAIDARQNLDNNIVKLNAGRWYISEQIDLHPGTKIEGANIEYGGNAGATSYPNKLSDAKGTVIIFDPSSETSLFVPILPKGGSNSWNAIAIHNMNIWGNTSMCDYHRTVFGDTDPVVTTSKYAIDFFETSFSSVQNVAINGFQSGVREGQRCAYNTYTNVHIERCRAGGVAYSELTNVAEPTSSVWTRCVIRTCLHAVQVFDSGGETWSGNSLHIRFHACLFEDIASHGFIIPKGAKDWTFVDCYGESIALDTGVADRACFRVGLDGSSAGNNVLTLRIIGGQYDGDDSAASTFLDVGLIDGIHLGGGATAKQFGVGIACTADTRDKSIFLDNFIQVDTTTFTSNADDKLWGNYRTVKLDGGSDIAITKVNYVLSEGDALRLQAPSNEVILGDGSTSTRARAGHDAMDLGQAGTRWRYIYAAELTTDANYLLWGKTAYGSVSTDGAALHKSGFVQASYTSSPAGYWNRGGTNGKLHIFYKAGAEVGSIEVAGASTTYNTTSDHRLKKDVISLTGSGQFIDALKPREWKWKDSDRRGVGFVAHELQAISPISVSGEKDAVNEDGSASYQSLTYSSGEIIANLVSELQMLRNRVKRLERVDQSE